MNSHTVAALGSAAVLTSVGAYWWAQTGQPPAILEGASVQRIADRLHRAVSPRARPVPYHTVVLLPQPGYQPTGQDVQQTASRLTMEHARLGGGLAGRVLMSVQLHADTSGQVVTSWLGPSQVVRLPGLLWPGGVETVDLATLADPDARPAAYWESAELVCTGGSPREGLDVAARLVGAVASVYRTFDPDQHEAAFVQAGLLPAGSALWAAQILINVHGDQPEQVRARVTQLRDAVAAGWGGRWRALRGAQAGDDLDVRLMRGVWRPSGRLLLTTAQAAGWLVLPSADTAGVYGYQDLHPHAPTPGQPTPPPDAARRPAAPSPQPIPAAEDADDDLDDDQDPADTTAAPPLPAYQGQPDVAPLGEITTPHGTYLAGIPLDDLLFAATFGQAGTGKSTLAMLRFLHMVTRTDWRGQPWGGLFLDPHQDAVDELRGHLVALGVPPDRIVEVALTADRMTGWNLFAVDTAREIPDRAGAVTAALSAAYGWTSTSAGQILGAVDAAARVLLEVALAVRDAGRPHLTPTIFQIPTLLESAEWRAYALAFAEDSRYAAHQLEIKTAASIITPIMRLRGRPEAVGLLGQPDGGYDIRAAMDDGKIVLLAPSIPGADEDLQAILINLFTLDVLRAALSRRDLRPADRRPFWVCLDEAHAYDRSGTIRRIVSEARKYMARGEFLTQYPRQLSSATWEALSTNAGLITTGALGTRDAEGLARRWSQVGPASISGLEQHTFLTQVPGVPGRQGRGVRPFRVRSVQLTDVYGPPADEEQVDGWAAQVDGLLGRVPIDDVVRDLNGKYGRTSLDARLLEWMKRHAPADRVPRDLLPADPDDDSEIPTERL